MSDTWLKPDALVIPVGYMGAPLVLTGSLWVSGLCLALAESRVLRKINRENAKWKGIQRSDRRNGANRWQSIAQFVSLLSEHELTESTLQTVEGLLCVEIGGEGCLLS